MLKIKNHVTKPIKEKMKGKKIQINVKKFF